MAAGSLTARAVADLVGGRLLGDGAVRIRAVRPLDSAGPDALSFAISSRYAANLDGSRAGAVLVPEALARAGSGPPTRIVVPDPYTALVRVLEALYPAEPPETGVDVTARIGARSVLG
ncbi:MAG TPA: LpxD N-terminal domain-containing protein, partial [Gemmatimonadales bacterium]|nr:LpxD N-terminal domain-containing protein [Gemmatimonadales bacterium]